MIGRIRGMTAPKKEVSLFRRDYFNLDEVFLSFLKLGPLRRPVDMTKFLVIVLRLQQRRTNEIDIVDHIDVTRRDQLRSPD